MIHMKSISGLSVHIVILLGSILLTGGCGGGKPKPQVDNELRVNLAELLIQSKAYDEALPMIRKAMQVKPNDARLYYLMGITLRDKGIYTEAESTLKHALRLDPKLAATYNAIGVLYSLTHRLKEAIAVLKRAIEINPNVARFHNNLGFAHYLSGNYEEAVKSYESSLRYAPSEKRVFVNLGFALGALQRDADARRIAVTVTFSAC